MLYRKVYSPSGPRMLALPSGQASDQVIGGAGGWGRLHWLNDQSTDSRCPVCATLGPHRLTLSVPSSITASARVVYARCRACGCTFVVDYQVPAYEAGTSSDAPLRFYVEQGAGFDNLARAVFVAAQKPTKTYLDIGCGFGFGLDMATRLFGWNAIGLDPGALAAAGREMLGVRIESGIALSDARIAGNRYDTIVAMEVLEHAVDPLAFLSDVRARLSDEGTLILSTPNARYLETDPNGDMLLPLLSPGYHPVLYTAGSLRTLLRRAGFLNVRIAQTPASLFVVASPSGWLPGLKRDIDRGMYLGYLRTRFHEVATGSALHTGFGYRLLRRLVEDHAYQDALSVFGKLRNAMLTTYGIDLDCPLDVTGAVLAAEVTFETIPEKFPFCLAGLLASRGSIAMDHERRPEQAACYFLAARFAAQMLLRALTAIGSGDGEIAALRIHATITLTGLLQDEPGDADAHDAGPPTHTRAHGRFRYV